MSLTSWVIGSSMSWAVGDMEDAGGGLFCAPQIPVLFQWTSSGSPLDI